MISAKRFYKMLSEAFGLKLTDAKPMYENFRIKIAGLLRNGEEINLPGFGKLYCIKLKEHDLTSPISGKKIRVKDGRRFYFRPFAWLKDRVDSEDSE